MFKQLLFATLLGLALAAPSTKVDPKLAKTLRNKPLADIFVKFGNGNTDILNGIQARTFATRGEKISSMVAAMKAHMKVTQGNALNIMSSPQFAYSAATFKQFWISNELSVKGANAVLVNLLASLPEVSEIREAIVVQIDYSKPIQTSQQNETIWNLQKIEAPNAWNLPGGNNGQGVVVSNIDTGVRVSHEALRNNYRADYGWFDPYDFTTEPYEADQLFGGHGTHTMGTIAGAGVGIAPGAQWVSCLACKTIFCSEDAFKSCGQWTLCPTLHNGTNEDCSKAPNLSSNSWGYAGYGDWYDDITNAWVAADIMPIFALGNEGHSCSTTRSPGERGNVIGVGATTSTDNIAGFSSTGPGPDGVLKPDISAPGDDIYSTYGFTDNSYGLMSGTSMACPHVAGAVALLLSRDSSLKYQDVKAMLEQNTDQNLGDGPTCGGTPPNQFPNNAYGHGRLNARKALEAVINRNSTLAV